MKVFAEFLSEPITFHLAVGIRDRSKEILDALGLVEASGPSSSPDVNVFEFQSAEELSNGVAPFRNLLHYSGPGFLGGDLGTGIEGVVRDKLCQRDLMIEESKAPRGWVGPSVSEGEKRRTLHTPPFLPFSIFIGPARAFQEALHTFLNDLTGRERFSKFGITHHVERFSLRPDWLIPSGGSGRRPRSGSDTFPNECLLKVWELLEKIALRQPELWFNYVGNLFDPSGAGGRLQSELWRHYLPLHVGALRALRYGPRSIPSSKSASWERIHFPGPGAFDQWDGQKPLGLGTRLDQLNRLKHYYYSWAGRYWLVEPEGLFGNLLDVCDPAKTVLGDTANRKLTILRQAFETDYFSLAPSHNTVADLFSRPPMLPPLYKFLYSVEEMRDYKGTSSGGGRFIDFHFVDNNQEDPKLYGAIRGIKAIFGAVRVESRDFTGKMEASVVSKVQTEGQGAIEWSSHTAARSDNLLPIGFSKARIIYHMAGPEGEVRSGQLDSSVWDRILDEGLNGQTIERYLIADFMLEPAKGSARKGTYTAADFLQGFVSRKRDRVANLVAGNRIGDSDCLLESLADKEWAMVASRHPMNVYLSVQEGTWDLQLGRYNLHPGEDPSLVSRIMPFLVKLAESSRGRHRAKADEDGALLLGAASEVIRQAKGLSRGARGEWPSPNIEKLVQPLHRFASSLARIRDELAMLTTSHLEFRDVHPATPLSAVQMEYVIWVSMILTGRRDLDRTELMFTTGAPFMLREQVELLRLAWPNEVRSGACPRDTNALGPEGRKKLLDDVQKHLDYVFSLVNALYGLQYQHSVVDRNAMQNLLSRMSKDLVCGRWTTDYPLFWEVFKELNKAINRILGTRLLN